MIHMVLLAENDSSAFSSLVFIYFMCMTWVGQVYYSKTNSLSLAFISSIHYFMIHIVCFERKESLTLMNPTFNQISFGKDSSYATSYQLLENLS
jgi:hypothetical protein